MKKSLACSATGLALVTGMTSLVQCTAAPADTEPVTGRSQAALRAVPTDPGTFVVRILDVNGNYDLLASNHTGYMLTCTGANGGTDLAGVRNMELAAGFSSLELSQLPPAVPITDSEVQQLISPSASTIITRANLLPLSCATSQSTLYEFDVARDNHRLFIDLGDKDGAGTAILHNVGCGELLIGLGLSPLSPTVLPVSLIGKVFVVSDDYDINCHTGQPPSGYTPALTATPQTQTVGRGEGITSVAFTVSENDIVPAGATLVATANDCSDTSGASFLALDQGARRVSGVVPSQFPRPSCSATYVLTYTLAGAAFQTAPVTMTLSMGCVLGTVDNCAACGDVCPVNAALGVTVCRSPGAGLAGTCGFEGPVCGNGTREQGEDCDDSNTANLDGCDASCKFEQNHRINQLSMQFVTDAYCTRNALGGAIIGAAQSQIQGSLDSGVRAGSINAVFNFAGGDLSGAGGSVTVGSVKGTPVGGGGAYNGNNDLDGWYTADPGSLRGQRQPGTALTGTYAAKVLSTLEGRLELPLALEGSPANLLLWNTNMRMSIGAPGTPLVSSGGTPGHLPLEHVDPALQSFATTTGGQICGNATTRSLATVAIPPVLSSGGSASCSEHYTAANTLLDVLVGGCHVFGFITLLAPTQPDQLDRAAPQSGAGGPYTLSASAAGRVVDTCKDQNSTVVPMDICRDAMAYSSSFRFTTERVILK